MNNLSEENIRLILGLKVKQLRGKKNLSQQELANAAGFSVSYLNEIEKGKKFPKNDKIIALAKHLDTTYENLVSVKLGRSLSPVGQILTSDLIQEIPLDTFGIDKNKLIEMISKAPAKVGAFINTIIDIARNYNMTQEHFYLASLRSYQEMYDNYFWKIEKSAEDFLKKFEAFHKTKSIDERLQLFLSEIWGIESKMVDYKKTKSLKNIRSIYIPTKKELQISNTLTEAQRHFVFAKEIGFNDLELSPRPYASWMKNDNFDELVNNFKASYFACAVLIPKQKIVADLQRFFAQKTWNGATLLEIFNSYDATPEMFFHRLTNILPREFGASRLFFIKYENNGTDKEITKELHLSRTQQHTEEGEYEVYYRRWMTKKMLAHLESIKGKPNDIILDITRSKYKTDEYLCFSLMRKQKNNPASFLTIGFALNEQLRSTIQFVNDPAIFFRQMDNEFYKAFITDDMLQKKLELETIEQEIQKIISQ